MTALYWIMMVFLLIVFIAKMSDGCNSNNRTEDRITDIMISITAFAMMYILRYYWR